MYEYRVITHPMSASTAGCRPRGALHRLARQLHHGRTLCPTSPGLPFLLNSGPGFRFLGEKASKRSPPCLGPVLAGPAPRPARRGWGAAVAPSHGSCRILPSTVLGVFLDLLAARTKDQELGIRENARWRCCVSCWRCLSLGGRDLHPRHISTVHILLDRPSTCRSSL